MLRRCSIMVAVGGASWMLLLQHAATAFVVPTQSFDAAPMGTIRSIISRQTATKSPLIINNNDDSALQDVVVRKEQINHADAIVCGGGPAGLLMAIALAQQQQPPSSSTNHKIHVYDRRGPPPPVNDDSLWSDQVARYYLIGLGDRGQAALQSLGVWEAVAAHTVIVRGRRDWSPGGPPEGIERIFDPTVRKVETHVLPRDKLVGVLAEHIQTHYSDRVTVHYGSEVTPVEFHHAQGTQALVRVAPCGSSTTTDEDADEDVTCDTESSALWSTDLLVAADGTVRYEFVVGCCDSVSLSCSPSVSSTIANAMQAEDEANGSLNRFHIRRYVDDNIRVYKTIPLQLSWRPDLNYSARTSRLGFDALPANKNGRYCGVLLLRPDDPLAQPNADPVALRALLETELPQFSPLIDDTVLTQVARKPVSHLPAFRYATPRLHHGASTIVLGDAAHTVKPYFGLGANSALEDVEELAVCLKTMPTIQDALHTFSKRRAKESKTLVRLSRDLDRPGKLGFLTFLGPIILDGIFGNLLPRLFAPNMITMLQRDSITFQQAARRKRLDRLGQLSLIGSGLVGSVMVVTRILRWGLARTTATQQRTIVGVASAMTALSAVVRRRRKAAGS